MTPTADPHSIFLNEASRGQLTEDAITALPGTPAVLTAGTQDAGRADSQNQGRVTRVKSEMSQVRRTDTFLDKPPLHHIFQCPPGNSVLLFIKDLFFIRISFASNSDKPLFLKVIKQSCF